MTDPIVSSSQDRRDQPSEKRSLNDPNESPCRGIELNAKVRGCMNQVFHTKKKVGGPISYKLGALITYSTKGRRTDFIQFAGSTNIGQRTHFIHKTMSDDH